MDKEPVILATIIITLSIIFWVMATYVILTLH